MARLSPLIAVSGLCVAALAANGCGPTYAEGNSNWGNDNNTGLDGGVGQDANQQQDGWVWPDDGSRD